MELRSVLRLGSMTLAQLKPAATPSSCFSINDCLKRVLLERKQAPECGGLGIAGFASLHSRKVFEYHTLTAGSWTVTRIYLRDRQEPTFLRGLPTLICDAKITDSTSRQTQV